MGLRRTKRGAASFMAAFASAFLIVAPGVAAPQGPVASLSEELLKPHLVEIELGRRLNLRCFGKGSPTVVFEQGGEGMIFNWAKVLPAVAAKTRTCVYDRGGFGWSDPPRYPVTAVSVTDDLHALLRKARIQGQVVLVGHSMGGFYATMYADRFLDEVAGLVLVEPAFGGQSSGMQGARRDLEQASIRSGEAGLLRCAELARLKKLTTETLATHGCFPPPTAEGEAARRYALHATTGSQWYLAEHSQSVNFFSADDKLSVSAQQEQTARRSFGALPLVVLSAATFASDPWRTADENKAAQSLWLSGHADLAKRSARGRHQVVEAAGHFIQRSQPDAVIQAVDEVVAQVRSQQR